MRTDVEGRIGVELVGKEKGREKREGAKREEKRLEKCGE